MSAKIAVAGAGIYGSSIAIRLAEEGHQVDLFDPLGVLRAASAINQFRIHSGYHYPRSPETIEETLEARAEFMRVFQPAIIRNTQHFYAIPKEGSSTSPELFESVMSQYGIAFRPSRPTWMNFDFIDRCYEVEEQLYDADTLRTLVISRLNSLGVCFEERPFLSSMRDDYDFVVFATYGLGASAGILKSAKYQIAEKVLIALPALLEGVSLVVIDGPFTAFDPYGRGRLFQFGSAKHSNHWTTRDPNEPVPEPYNALLNRPSFERVPFSRFSAMREDAQLAVPCCKAAVYMGSRFTIRVVEDNPAQDRRTLSVVQTGPGELHIFSGKVVSAVKAARIVANRIGSPVRLVS